MKRPLRVIGLGWETIAPGVVANAGLAGGKTSLFQAERLEVSLAAAKKLQTVEAALARGGSDKSGADIALLSLPSFVAAYERLRALSPQIFFVVGWSRGQHALLGKPRVSLMRPPSGTVAVLGRPGRPESLLALAALELAGVPLRRTRLVSPSHRRADRAPFAAVELPLPGADSRGRRFLLSTADARHLVPIVAVAPRGLIEQNRDALVVWSNIWLKGVERLHRDVPGAARRIAKIDGAPEALGLLKRLGQIEPAGLIDNARLGGLSGRSAITLERLFHRCWRIWRATGVLASPAPAAAPLSLQTMSELVRSYPSLVEQLPAGPRGKRSPAAGGGKSTTSADGTRQNTFRPLLVHRPVMRRWLRHQAVDAVGELAAIFSRARLRVSVRGSLRRSRKLIAAVGGRFDLSDPSRIHPAAREEGRPLAIEIDAAQ